MDGQDHRPLLIIVNGRPATGKSAVAARISERLEIPLFTKDEVKELLGEVVGAADRDAARVLGEASIALIFQHAEAVLATGVDAIVECPLIPELTVPVLAGLEERTHCRFLQLFFVADPEVILERYGDRDRSDVHFDDEARKELEASLRTSELEPVPLPAGETWTIDTTDFEAVNVDGIVERVRQQTSSESSGGQFRA